MSNKRDTDDEQQQHQQRHSPIPPAGHRAAAFKMPYVFGSSTPREFSYLDHIPAKYRVYNVKMRMSRRTTREEPTLRDFMNEIRNPSPTSRRRDRSVDSASRLFVFGSSTPREMSYLERVPAEFRVYDVKLGGALGSSSYNNEKRSKTTTFSGSSNGQHQGGKQYLRRSSSLSSHIDSASKQQQIVDNGQPSVVPSSSSSNKRRPQQNGNSSAKKAKARNNRTLSVPASIRSSSQQSTEVSKRISRRQTTPPSQEVDAKHSDVLEKKSPTDSIDPVKGHSRHQQQQQPSGSRKPPVTTHVVHQRQAREKVKSKENIDVLPSKILTPEALKNVSAEFNNVQNREEIVERFVNEHFQQIENESDGNYITTEKTIQYHEEIVSTKDINKQLIESSEQLSKPKQMELSYQSAKPEFIGLNHEVQEPVSEQEQNLHLTKQEQTGEYDQSIDSSEEPSTENSIIERSFHEDVKNNGEEGIAEYRNHGESQQTPIQETVRGVETSPLKRSAEDLQIDETDIVHQQNLKSDTETVGHIHENRYSSESQDDEHQSDIQSENNNHVEYNQHSLNVMSNHSQDNPNYENNHLAYDNAPEEPAVNFYDQIQMPRKEHYEIQEQVESVNEIYVTEEEFKESNTILENERYGVIDDSFQESARKEHKMPPNEKYEVIEESFQEKFPEFRSNAETRIPSEELQTNIHSKDQEQNDFTTNQSQFIHEFQMHSTYQDFEESDNQDILKLKHSGLNENERFENRSELETLNKQPNVNEFNQNFEGSRFQDEEPQHIQEVKQPSEFEELTSHVISNEYNQNNTETNSELGSTRESIEERMDKPVKAVFEEITHETSKEFLEDSLGDANKVKFTEEELHEGEAKGNESDQTQKMEKIFTDLNKIETEFEKLKHEEDQYSDSEDISKSRHSSQEIVTSEIDFLSYKNQKEIDQQDQYLEEVSEAEMTEDIQLNFDESDSDKNSVHVAEADRLEHMHLFPKEDNQKGNMLDNTNETNSEVHIPNEGEIFKGKDQNEIEDLVDKMAVINMAIVGNTNLTLLSEIDEQDLSGGHSMEEQLSNGDKMHIRLEKEQVDENISENGSNLDESLKESNEQFEQGFETDDEREMTKRRPSGEHENFNEEYSVHTENSNTTEDSAANDFVHDSVESVNLNLNLEQFQNEFERLYGHEPQPIPYNEQPFIIEKSPRSTVDNGSVESEQHFPKPFSYLYDEMEFNLMLLSKNGDLLSSSEGGPLEYLESELERSKNIFDRPNVPIHDSAEHEFVESKHFTQEFTSLVSDENKQDFVNSKIQCDNINESLMDKIGLVASGFVNRVFSPDQKDESFVEEILRGIRKVKSQQAENATISTDEKPSEHSRSEDYSANSPTEEEEDITKSESDMDIDTDSELEKINVNQQHADDPDHERKRQFKRPLSADSSDDFQVHDFVLQPDVANLDDKNVDNFHINDPLQQQMPVSNGQHGYENFQSNKELSIKIPGETTHDFENRGLRDHLEPIETTLSSSSISSNEEERLTVRKKSESLMNNLNEQFLTVIDDADQRVSSNNKSDDDF